MVAAGAGPVISCASSPDLDSGVADRSVIITPGVLLELPRRPDLGRRIEAVQSVKIRRRDSVFAFETRLSIADGRFRFAALDLAGRRALTLDWTERGIEMETASWLPEEFRPRNLLADMVLMFWPAEDVRVALAGNDTPIEADTGHRSIWANGKEMVRIEFRPPRKLLWTGTTMYDNIGFGYSLEVRSIEVVP